MRFIKVNVEEIIELSEKFNLPIPIDEQSIEEMEIKCPECNWNTYNIVVLDEDEEIGCELDTKEDVEKLFKKIEEEKFLCPNCLVENYYCLYD